MNRFAVALLALGMVGCDNPPDSTTPAQRRILDNGEVALIAIAPDGTHLWGVRGDVGRIIYFASTGTQTSHTENCGKNCVRTVDDIVPSVGDAQ